MSTTRKARDSKEPSGPAKRAKVVGMNAASKGVAIGTHSGNFHCDDALACYMLRLTDNYAGAPIVRTRDPEVLNSLDVVVDVGAEYDPVRKRFDHHQAGFSETLSPKHSITLSSAGLVYKHFGREILRKLAPDLSNADLETVYFKVYESFIMPIDAIDNGVNQFDTKEKPRYRITTDLSSRVGHLNPMWNESATDDDLLARFHQAMELTGTEFEQAVTATVISWLPARQVVFDAVKNRTKYDPSGQVVVFEDVNTAWKSHIYDAEKELKCDRPLLYVIYKDNSDTWRIQCVSTDASSFENRKSLPSQWRGVRDEDLSSVTRIDGCVFCHKSGFIAGHKSFEGVMEMARKALTDSSA